MRTELRWYGWQTAAVDAAGLGLSLVARLASPYLLATLAGAPAVHFAHGHPVRGLVDFGMRAALPLAAGLVAAGPYDPPPSDAGAKLHRFATGAIVVAALVAVFDAAIRPRRGAGPGPRSRVVLAGRF